MNKARWFVGGVIVLGLIGVSLSGSPVYWRMLYLGLLLGVSSWLWITLVARLLKVERSARVLRANVGDIFEEKFEVFNGSRLFASWIEISNRSNLPFASGARLLTFVGGRQRRSYLARTWLTRRGAFRLGPTTLTVSDPLALFRVTREFAESRTLVILPKLFDIVSFVFPAGILAGGQVIRRKSPEITPHAAGVRDYSVGDAMKRIHWPISMHRSHLTVKEFEQDPQAEVWLILDSQRGVHFENPHDEQDVSVESILFARKPRFELPPSTLEYCVSIAASLAHYLVAQRRAVGFAAAGQTMTLHPAERSSRQELKILETLAFVQANGELSIAALISAQAAQIPQGSTVVLITPSIENELVSATEDLQRRHLRPIFVLLDPSSFGAAIGSEQIRNALRLRGASVCFVECGANLSATLSEFSSQFASQDLRTWRRPLSIPSI